VIDRTHAKALSLLLAVGVCAPVLAAKRAATPPFSAAKLNALESNASHLDVLLAFHSAREQNGHASPAHFEVTRDGNVDGALNIDRAGRLVLLGGLHPVFPNAKELRAFRMEDKTRQAAAIERMATREVLKIAGAKGNPLDAKVVGAARKKVLKMVAVERQRDGLEAVVQTADLRSLIPNHESYERDVSAHGIHFEVSFKPDYGSGYFSVYMKPAGHWQITMHGGRGNAWTATVDELRAVGFDGPRLEKALREAYVAKVRRDRERKIDEALDAFPLALFTWPLRLLRK
jgi:hypothetical protein